MGPVLTSSLYRLRAVIALLALAFIGAYVLQRSHAAVVPVAVEVESGTKTTAVRTITTAGASGGSAALFASSVSFTPTGMRVLPDPLYGVTVDDVSNIASITASLTALQRKPITRVVFDAGVAPSYYQNAISQIQPVSYIMGEVADSTELKDLSAQQYHDKVASYLAAHGSTVDLWEVGNEVNGNWTGPYTSVSAKIYDAYLQVKTAGKRSALTLWYDDSCGNGPTELDPVAFSSQYVPADMRGSLDYLFVSYYETQCNNIRPTAATLTTFFNQLHALYPSARLGFGEVGFPDPVTGSTTAAASMINYYYGLHISTPQYVGGYFWWYYYEDMLPHTSKQLWPILNNALSLY